MLGGRGVVGTDLQLDVAANAMQEGVGPAFSRLDRERERCVDPARGAFRVLSFGFELGEQTFVSLLGMCGEQRSLCQSLFGVCLTSETGNLAEMTA